MAVSKRREAARRNPVGRPTKYDRGRHPKLAYKLCMLGLTDEELAEHFLVTRSTVALWKREHPEFSDAITRAREQADGEVVMALYKRALGYSHKAVRIFPGTAESGPVYATYTVHIPPDVQAASLWLRNRQPKKWRDKVQLEHANTEGQPGQPGQPFQLIFSNADSKL